MVGQSRRCPIALKDDAPGAGRCDQLPLEPQPHPPFANAGAAFDCRRHRLLVEPDQRLLDVRVPSDMFGSDFGYLARQALDEGPANDLQLDWLHVLTLVAARTWELSWLLT